MTSTTLDVCLCLLLISGAAVTVASVAPPEADPDRADAVADSLAATTTVEYSLSPGAAKADPALATFDRTEGPEFQRTAHGTLASLLGRATIRTVRVDGEPLTHAGDDFQAQVAAATMAALPPRTQIVVEWRPYTGAHLGRRLALGPTPPPTADVHAATVRVPSGMAAPANATSVAREEGFDGLSNAVAAAVIGGLLPPKRTRLALAGDAPVDTLVRYRYRRVAAVYGANVSTSLQRGDTRAANAKLTDAAAPRIETELRAAFDSPTAAARGLDLGSVDVVVRTWER